MAKNPFSAVGAAAELQRRQGKVKMAVKEAEGKGKPRKAKPKPRKKPKGTSLKAARATKHVGSEGEVAYGQRMTPRPGARKSRFKEKSRN